MRIDHILVNYRLRVVNTGVDREKRGREGASDHAPVWAELEVLEAAEDPKPKKKRARQQSASPEAEQVSGAAPESLTRYNAKRDFSKTAEPAGVVHRRAAGGADGALQFVVQKHWASRLHYDFRLELDWVMLSWAVPKGLSYDPKVKSIAIHVEDHPVSYNTFEGTIPKGEYGAGTVIVWDRGTWEPVGDAHRGLADGKIVLRVHGQKLAGLWELVRISKPGEKKQEQWMLFKKRATRGHGPVPNTTSSPRCRTASSNYRWG